MRLFFLFLIGINVLLANAQDKSWNFTLHGGVVHNAALPLTIVQEGYEDIYIKKAVFYSEPLISPFYWDWRFSKNLDKRAIEFEAIHHKLYLKNLPAEVQRFGISHGFNMLFLNHCYTYKKVQFRTGAGSVLLHPESTIRNMAYPEGKGFDIKGYRLRGICINLAAAKQLNLNKRYFVNVEGKITLAKANSPVVLGYAKVNNIAFHLILGPGFRWNLK